MQQRMSIAVVQSINLFSALQSADCEYIASQASQVSFSAGDIIVSRSEQRREMYCLVTGTVHVTSFSANGREVSYKEKTAGEIFGELSAIDGEPRCADVYAKTDVVLLQLKPALLDELMRKHPELAIYLLKRFAGEVRSLTARVYSFSALSVSNRIRQMILQMAEDCIQNGCDDALQNAVLIEQFPTHAQLASRVATTREAVTREISKLASDGYIVKEEGGIFVKDVMVLRTLVESELL